MAKITKGRQKIPIVKMENESNLQVTFSKRRSGLFKKASEICTLCAAEVAIIVFSPGDKAYSFGHPSVEAVLQRFLSGSANTTAQQQINPETLHIMEMHRNATMRELNLQLSQMLAQMEVEKKRSKDIKQTMRVTQIQCLWKPVEELNLPELERLKVSLEGLKKTVTKQVERVLVQTANTPSLQPYFNGASSSAPGPSGSAVPYDHVNNNIGGFNDGGFINGGEFNGGVVPHVPYNYPYGRGFF